MRIQLDYYRILGLPIQATAEQLQQAYRDRAVQLPRREYSELAIAARKQLLDRAYKVLSDTRERALYDATFLGNNVKTAETTSLEANPELVNSASSTTVEAVDTDFDPFNPTIEIKNEQFVGALLILQELGEYELILKLSRPYLTNGSMTISLDKGRLGDPDIVRADIVLTVALACLELGREQWQQGQYENAALSLETGQELLIHEGIFPTVSDEIQADLYKLRPYRILELLALSEKNLVERHQGLHLLQAMLQERGGIDGNGNDRSGLSIDDFLRFIQQLRSYLTSSEQQTLFEAEANRPSAVATYLAVYALLAKGFAERHPSLIRQAKVMLTRLGKRQDVHLEQAVCALLLGQTDDASRALELSQESETLDFIREHSQGSPDLLPGLCFYAERWLQTEVFPHFRDLAEQKVSLREYFAQEQVQVYLETLPADTDSNNELLSQRLSYSTQSFRGISTSSQASATRLQVGEQSYLASGEVSNNFSEQDSENRVIAEVVFKQGKTTLNRTGERSPGTDASTLPTAERISEVGPSLETDPTSELETVSRQQRRHTKAQEQTMTPLEADLRSSGAITRVVEPENAEPLRLPPGRSKRSSKFKISNKNQRLILLGIGGIVGLTILGFLGIATYGWLQKTIKSLSAPKVPGNYPLVQLDKPPIPIPNADDTKTTGVQGDLTEATAQEVVETWLSTKSKAMGSEHGIEQLQQILTDSALSRWEKNAQTAKKNNSYWQYEHGSEVKSVQKNDKSPDRAKVEAVVTESAKLYEGGKLSKSSSYNEKLRVQYDLVQKNNQWFIRDMTVLK